MKSSIHAVFRHGQADRQAVIDDWRQVAGEVRLMRTSGGKCLFTRFTGKTVDRNFVDIALAAGRYRLLRHFCNLLAVGNSAVADRNTSRRAAGGGDDEAELDNFFHGLDENVVIKISCKLQQANDSKQIIVYFANFL